MVSDVDETDREIRKLFGNRVAELRGHAGLTQAQLGERIGRSVEQVASIENGRSGIPVRVAARIARTLEIPLPDLFDLADQPAGESEKRRILRELIKTIRHDDPATLRLISRLAAVVHEEQ